MTDESGHSRGFLLLGADVTERRLIQNQLDQRQKLEAMSRLAVGIASEINSPLKDADREVRVVKERFERLAQSMGSIVAALEHHPEGGLREGALAEAAAALEQADVKYLCGEIAKAVDASVEYIERTKRIVADMKSFSRTHTEGDELVDVNMAIESIAILCRNEWKRIAELKTRYDPSLPAVRCAPGDLDQVILNLVVNSADAIEQVIPAGSTERGLITITTRSQGESVEIHISDNGPGIKDDVAGKIFDLFFTTKPTGTGHGLAMCRAVIEEKLEGTIDFHTEIGKGTTFVVRLPVRVGGV
jgi:signal transduction histidine kinase